MYPGNRTSVTFRKCANIRGIDVNIDQSDDAVYKLALKTQSIDYLKQMQLI